MFPTRNLPAFYFIFLSFILHVLVKRDRTSHFCSLRLCITSVLYVFIVSIYSYSSSFLFHLPLSFLDSTVLHADEVKRVEWWKPQHPGTLSGHCDRGQEWKHTRVKGDHILVNLLTGFHPSTRMAGIDSVILFCFPTSWIWPVSSYVT